MYELIDAEIGDALRDGRLVSIGRLCSVLIRSAGAWPWAAFGADPGPLLATLQSAESRMAEDPAAHARLLAALAIGSCYAPDGAIPDRLSRSAIDLAESLADSDVLADALLGRALTFSGIAERVQESAALLDRLASLPHAATDVNDVLRHGLMTMIHATLGDMIATAEHCRLGIAGSDALRLPVSRVQFRLTESLIALWQGRFDDAERAFQEGVRLREQTELYFGGVRVAMVVSRWKQGRILSLLDEWSNETDVVEQVCVAVAKGDVELADRLIGEWLDRDQPVIWTSHGNWALLANMVADAGLARHAPRLIELLGPLSGLIAIVGQLTAVSPVSLTLARLHHLLGDDEAARPELGSAIELCARSGGGPSAMRGRLFAYELDGASQTELAQLIADAGAAGLTGIVRDARAIVPS